MPVLREKIPDNGSAAAKIARAITQLPPELIREVFEAVPREEKNEIVVMLVEENKNRIISIANEFTRKNEAGITIRDLSVTSELEIHAAADEIDYRSIAVKFLPLVRQRLASARVVPAMLRPLLARAPAEEVLRILDRIPQNVKDDIVIFVVNQNQERIKDWIIKTAQDHDIALTVETLEIHS